MSIYEINFCLICNLFCAISDYKTYEKILGQFLKQSLKLLHKVFEPIVLCRALHTYVLTMSFTLALYFTFSCADCSDCIFNSSRFFCLRTATFCRSFYRSATAHQSSPRGPTQMNQIAKTRQKLNLENSWNWQMLVAPAMIWQVLNVKCNHKETKVM